ncbi:MAG: NERD domain-containing protein [Opitutus sp.]|nr:NERD domain-containing protein [Opitutus sp.]
MLQPWIVLVAYAALFVGFVGVLVFWRLFLRRNRRPFPDTLKLLRGPGESQRRRLEALEERTITQLLMLFSLPVACGAALWWMTLHLDGDLQIIALAATLSLLVVGLFFLARFLVARMQESANRYLGYFGERVVAEALEPLKSRGWRVFHDLPGEAETGPTFNIDHVVVGPAGVFAIETKTRRKGRARNGFAAHEIIFDGNVLAYPWGEDRHGLEQSRQQAAWLEDWLALKLGIQTVVTPVLVFPGWTIIRRGTGSVTVVNPKELAAAIDATVTPVLTPSQVDLIARQLETRCRDVEY